MWYFYLLCINFPNSNVSISRINNTFKVCVLTQGQAYVLVVMFLPYIFYSSHHKDKTKNSTLISCFFVFVTFVFNMCLDVVSLLSMHQLSYLKDNNHKNTHFLQYFLIASVVIKDMFEHVQNSAFIFYTPFFPPSGLRTTKAHGTFKAFNLYQYGMQSCHEYIVYNQVIFVILGDLGAKIT